MERREFVRLAGMGAGAVVVPIWGRPVSDLGGSLTPIPTADKKVLADAALDVARSRNASYADVRIGRYLNQFISARDTKIQNVTSTESFGAGIRVIVNDTWGFAATNDVTVDGITKAAREAAAIALANSRYQTEPVRLAPQRGFGEVAWRTPIEINAFEVPISEKADMLAGGRITLLVSHRFSTVRMADRIVVLDGARVVEVGSHAELMANRSQYSELYEIQAAAYR